MQQKIVITGGPGTGKSTVINELERRGFYCIHEISRQVTLDAREKGIEQLFLTNPLLFSEMLLEGRTNQYISASNSDPELVFFDRGIPDVFAYMDFTNSKYPTKFKQLSKEHLYTTVFLMPPWKDIYKSDNERYESYEESLEIYRHIKNAYTELGYSIIEVPFGSVKERTDFVLESLLIK
ncbi:ATP-binding protein [Urechidicola vernalis]|uniref:ATP-binding protein n=1 Tax=Urechidicola vernalis TaxID=3075600 RepID=A0ABU2Y1N6_9FLAO|nr:ATP-binding protein [Urechidicola sp. P050]MDT0552082.1 ATP-binding protein [Urechidicola sp. P050]